MRELPRWVISVLEAAVDIAVLRSGLMAIKAALVVFLEFMALFSTRIRIALDDLFVGRAGG
jgi:hypothetical protein